MLERVQQLDTHALIRLPPIPCALFWADSPPMCRSCHHGSGYRFMAGQIATVDSRMITASRMAKVFSRCSGYGPERQRVMRQAIDQLASQPLSTNTAEVVQLLLT